MFFVQNTSAQFKIIDSLITSSNQSNIAFVQIQPIRRSPATKSPEARKFDHVTTESTGFIKIHTEPTESIQRFKNNKSSEL